jgi:hypothetical protein
MKNFPNFYGTRRFISVSETIRHWSLSGARSIQPISLNPVFLKCILISPSHLRLGLPSGLFPSGFPYTQTSPMRAACHAHCIFLELIIYNLIWRRAQIMKLLIMQLFSNSLLFRSRFSFQHPLLKCPQSKFFFKCQSFPHIQNYSKIIVLFILIFTFLDRRREDKRLWAEW